MQKYGRWIIYQEKELDPMLKFAFLAPHQFRLKSILTQSKRGDTFISMPFLDQILSADFLSKFFKLF